MACPLCGYDDGPVLADFYSGAGGAGYGYGLAGFHVVGIDTQPQPRYPFEFVQADALTFPLDGFDAYHGSPPCHDHTPLASVAGTDGTGWMLDATRERFRRGGKPWVIENVPGAPMRPDLKLCGCMFGLRLDRVRWFELSEHFGLIMSVEHRRSRCRRTSSVTKNRRAMWDLGYKVSVTGDVGTYLGPEALGIDWMTGNELSLAVPPAYTEFIGGQLAAALGR